MEAKYFHFDVRFSAHHICKTKVPKDEIILKKQNTLNHFIAIAFVSGCLQSLKKT